jgi:NAD(P)-dependent dehydrogenase (short-subunit alcohol dehydrogenase family)
MSQQRVVLVTGVSSGIGRAIAETLARRDFRVFGTLRSQAHPPPSGVEPVVLDVRDEASVRAAVDDVVARAGRIDAVVNNAGGTLLGAIEETDLAQAQALFDVNFFGAVRVTRAALPHMRAQGRGRVLFVSSVVGFLPAPFMGFYAASKHALEGYAESLDHEVRTLGVRVSLIEPGFVRTQIDRNSVVAGHPVGAYTAMRERVTTGINAQVQAAEDPSVVAAVVLRALTDRAPRLRYRAGRGAALLAALRSFMPPRAFDRALRKQFHMDA